ncbi:MAG: hypothetical protein ACPGOV_06175 [Magnetovibrionaceae bacterium]
MTKGTDIIGQGQAFVEERHAIGLMLSGPLLSAAMTAQRLLAGGLGLSLLAERSPFPHITLAAGRASEAAVSALMTVVARKTETFVCEGVGLDVLGTDTPALVIRFSTVGPLGALYHRLNRTAGDLWDPVEPSMEPDIWIAKAALAFGDLKADQVPQALRILGSLNFEGPLTVDRLALLAYGPDGERLVTVEPLREPDRIKPSGGSATGQAGDPGS